MKKKYITIMFVITVILFIVGIILIFSATPIGNAVFTAKLQANGGVWIGNGLDTIRENVVISNRIVGVIIASIGGIGAITFGYGIYKQLED